MSAPSLFDRLRGWLGRSFSSLALAAEPPRGLPGRLPIDTWLPLLQPVSIAARRSALLAALDSLGVIPDLAALCDEYAHSGLSDGWSLPVPFLQPGQTDVVLRVRDWDHFQRKPSECPHPSLMFPRFMAAVFDAMLVQLPQLTTLSIGITTRDSFAGAPTDCLPGFDWSVLGEFTALRSLTLKTSESGDDHASWVEWDEPTAIDAIRRLPHLTFLDVSGCRRWQNVNEWTIGRSHAMRAFNIASFARPPLVHASLTRLELSGGWCLGKWTEVECAAFRSLPQLRTIDGLSLDRFMQRNDAMETVVDEEPED